MIPRENVTISSSYLRIFILINSYQKYCCRRRARLSLPCSVEHLLVSPLFALSHFLLNQSRVGLGACV